MDVIAKEILDFWFIETTPEQKFKRSDEFDKKIEDKFLIYYKKAIKGEYNNWKKDPDECLALIILFDQFSRNLFRSNPKAFEMDIQCSMISKFAIKHDYHKKLPVEKIFFIFLPLMHSENLDDQILCNKLIDIYLKDHTGFKDIKKFAIIHHDIIAEFGRFPYRNKVLGRKNTKKEDEYLSSKHFDFFNI
mgnify:FL=1